jgi:hypothetical protein
MLAVLELPDIVIAICCGVAALAVELSASELPDILVTIGKSAGSEAVTPPCGITATASRQVTLLRSNEGLKVNGGFKNFRMCHGGGSARNMI